MQSDSALEYTVTGIVTDADSGVASVMVNGVEAIIEGSTFSAVLLLATNTTHTITVTATDNAGNVNTVERYLRVLPAGSQMMSSKNGHSGKYAYTDLKYCGMSQRTYHVHVASITGGTVQIGTKYTTYDNDLVVKINANSAGWYTFTYKVPSSADAYIRIACCMADGTSATATEKALTAVGSAGTAIIDQIYIE